MCYRGRQSRAWALTISLVSVTHDQYYTIALTALYIYDYLLTFSDEVFLCLTTQAKVHCGLTMELAGQIRMEGKEDIWCVSYLNEPFSMLT